MSWEKLRAPAPGSSVGVSGLGCPHPKPGLEGTPEREGAGRAWRQGPCPPGETGATCPHVAAGRRVRSGHEVAAPRAAPAPLLGPAPTWNPRAERLRDPPGAGVGGMLALGSNQVRFPVEQVLEGCLLRPWGRP